jgi:hypothetical protein
MDAQDKYEIIRQGVKWIFTTEDIKKTTGLITFKGCQVQDMYLLLLKYKQERYTGVLRGSL